MNENRKKWLEAYIESGDAVKAVEMAYPEVSVKNRSSKASHLKSELAQEIDNHGRENYKKEVPLMMNVIKELALNSEQDAVKLKAANSWLSRAGHDAALVIKDETPKSYDELLRNVQIALTGFDEDTINQLIPAELVSQLRGKDDAKEETKH
jgi:hypothetical protein